MRTDHRLTNFTLPDGTTITTRSALEARWAIFFSELRLKWKYEPAPLLNYTPDFFVLSLGYIEIKPTLELLISESSERIKAAALKYPADRFFALIGNKVTFETCALYLGKKIFAPTWQQMVKLFYENSDSGEIDDHITIAMNRANHAKLDHFVSVGKILEL